MTIGQWRLNVKVHQIVKWTIFYTLSLALFLFLFLLFYNFFKNSFCFGEKFNDLWFNPLTNDGYSARPPAYLFPPFHHNFQLEFLIYFAEECCSWNCKDYLVPFVNFSFWLISINLERVGQLIMTYFNLVNNSPASNPRIGQDLICRHQFISLFHFFSTPFAQLHNLSSTYINISKSIFF